MKIELSKQGEKFDKHDKFEIKKIIEIGMELNFILTKNGKELYAYSNSSVDKKKFIKSPQSGNLHVDFQDKNFKKINESIKDVTIQKYPARPFLKGEIIQLSDKNSFSLDCGFIINGSLSKEKMRDLKIGDYVSIDDTNVWVYDLEIVKK